MSAEHFAIKYGPPLIIAPLAPWIADLPFDAWWLVFLPLGLVLGWMARAGRMAHQHQGLRAIMHDLLVSMLVVGGNALLAAMIINQFHLPYLSGLAVAFGCAFGGVASVEQIDRLKRLWAWLQRHVVDDLRGEEANDVQRGRARRSLEADSMQRLDKRVEIRTEELRDDQP